MLCKITNLSSYTQT